MKKRIGIILTILLVWSVAGIASKDYMAKNRAITWSGTTTTAADSSIMMDTLFLFNPEGFNAGRLRVVLDGPVGGGNATSGAGLADSGWIVLMKEVHFSDTLTSYLRFDSVGPEELVDTFLIFAKDIIATVGDTLLTGPIWAEVKVLDSTADSVFTLTYTLHTNWHLK